jgi:hypothetical protein
VKACVDGALQPDTCTPGSPQPETCNGIDDNCNGSVDEGTDVPTTCGVGACAATGVIACVNGAPQADTCTPHAPAANDATCDGIDDDCDGSVDEDFVSVATTCGVGACSATGHTVCVNGTIADTCVPGTPGPEVGCDGIDNDCNPATPDVMDGDGDSVTCASDCNDADPAVFPGAPEINDGKDNQCPGDAGYGLIDEISSHAGFLTPGDKTAYSWPAQSGATAYEVARADSSDFSSGCQSNQTSTPSWIDAAVPTSGKAFYYLVRAVTPFTGTWGKRSSGAQRTVSCSGP